MKDKLWVLVDLSYVDNTIHIYPQNDSKKHVLGKTCSCKPEVEKEKNGETIIHRAFDGREKVERYIEGIKEKMKKENIPSEPEQLQEWLSDVSQYYH